MGTLSRWLSAGLLPAVLSASSCLAVAPPAAAGDFTLPPNIQAIMKKLSSGQVPSAEDEKALSDFAAGMQGRQSGSTENPGDASDNGGDTPKPGGVYGFSVGNDDDSDEPNSPCTKAGTAVGLGQTPSRDAYLAMVDKVFLSFGGKLDGKRRDGLIGSLQASKVPTAGSDLASILMVVGETDTAVLSAAEAAGRAPDDALSANNLGAMLKGAGDFADAAVALQYAASKAPKSPLVATNLGWLALTQGYSKAAGGFFAAAVAQNPEMAPALNGQGMIAACAGKAAEALPLFRASLKIAYTDVAANGIDHTEQVIRDNTKEGKTPDIGKPDAYGPKGGLTNSTGTPLWPKMLFAPDAETLAAYTEKQAYHFFDLWSQQMSEAAGPARFARIPPDAERGTTFDGHRFVFTRGYDKEAFVVHDIKGMFDIQSTQILNDFQASIEALIQKNGCFTCAGLGTVPHSESCSYYRAKATANYAAFLPVAHREWERLQEALADLYGYSAPWIARIHDPATAGHLWVDLNDDMAMAVSSFAGGLRFVGLEIDSSWMAGDPDCNKANAAPSKPQKVKPYKDDATKCRTPPMVMPTPVASMNADCNQITVQLGIGPFATSLQYNFSPDYTLQNGVYVNTSGNDGSWTLFAGQSLPTDIEAPMGLDVKVGNFITFQGGHVTDWGGEADVGGNFTGGSVGVRFGAMSGWTGMAADMGGTGWSSQ